MAYGAPVFLGENQTGIGSVAGVTITTVAAIAVGDLVLVAAYMPDDGNAARPTVLSVTDSGGNTYAVSVTKRHSTSGDRYLIMAACLGASNAVAIGGTITVTMTSNTASFKHAIACKSSGVAASLVDKTATSEGAGTPWSSGSTGTLADGNEIAFGFATGRGNFSSGTPANTPNTGWTEVANTYQSNIEYVLQYKILSGDTSAQNPGGAWDSAYTWWLAAVATYRLGSVQRAKVKSGGAFAAKPVKVKSGGSFVEKPVKVKVGGVFV